MYGIAINGTTNFYQFIRADLTTFGLSILSTLDGYFPLSSAAVVDQEGIYWTPIAQQGQRGHTHEKITPTVQHRTPHRSSHFHPRTFEGQNADSVLLIGLSTQTGKILQSFPTTGWLPNASIVLIECIFTNPNKADNLFIVARDPKVANVQALLDFNTHSGAVHLRGTVSATGGDCAWNPAGDLLYEIYAPDDTTSGSLLVLSTAPPTRAVGTIALQNFFALPAWDDQNNGLVGLVLTDGAAGSHGRNTTVLFPQALTYNTTVLGSGLGPFYVLFDGPKAFDAEHHRAFYVIATSPMGEMDLVTVSTESGAVLESPSLCGWVGECPEAIAYHSA